MKQNPIDQLTHWLQQPVYLEGVTLYSALIGPGFMLNMLKAGVDDYNRECLSKALSNRLDEFIAEQKAQKESYPPVLVSELGTGGILMDERTILKERMRVLFNSGITESDDLKTMAFRILDIKDLLDGIYGRKNFFETNGFLPDAVNTLPEADTPASLLHRRATLRTYVSKYTRTVAEECDPKKLKKAKVKLLDFQTELHDIDAHLTQLTPAHD